MSNESVKNYWLGFIVAAVGIGWLIWLWRKQREVMPRPLHIGGRTTRYPLPAEETLREKPADDNLEAIEGIGPTYARRLNEAGITTYEQLSATKPAQLREITGVLRWNPADWISQAQRMGESEKLN